MSRLSEVVRRALARHDIVDTEAYLESVEDTLPIDSVAPAFVELRGNVHMMLGREITRRDVAELAKGLKYV